MLTYAMPKVEDMRGASRVRVGSGRAVRRAKAGKHPGDLGVNLRRVGKQHVGVNIALQRLGQVATGFVTHQRAR